MSEAQVMTNDKEDKDGLLRLLKRRPVECKERFAEHLRSAELSPRAIRKLRDIWGLGWVFRFAGVLFKSITSHDWKCGKGAEPGMWKIFGLTFSIGSSLERRLQTLAAASFSLYIYVPLIIICFWLSFCFLVFPPTTLLMVAYVAAIKWGKGSVSGKRSPWLRSASWWQYFADFFPVTVVKTATLPPDGKYIIGYHPHGIISVGAFAAFCTEGVHAIDLTCTQEPSRGWHSLFPGVDRRLVTLPMNFVVPFLREYFLSLGLLSSSRESFRNILSAQGNAVAVVVGGADEAQVCEPHTIQLVLQKRKGFVREALISGAALVPTLAFGENDLYVTTNFAPGHPLQKLQAQVLRIFGFSLPFFRGRGLFSYDFGFLPTRQPVTIVVGAPIAVPSVDTKSFWPKWDKLGVPVNDDAKIVDTVHQRYIEELRLLSKEYKGAEWNLPGQDMMVRKESLKIVK